MSLSDLLQRRRTTNPDHRPTFFRLPQDADALAALLRQRPDAVVLDTYAEQTRGLLETRDPLGCKNPETLAGRVAERLGERPDEGGTWAWFSWSQTLVHLLDEADYRELRTSRNRHKITLEEQETLRGLHIGIVGLSIGQAAAVTLTLEEVGGLLVLADFDHLELSNMNRLRAGVQGLGVNKAVLASREIHEINPYARVELMTEGLHADNLDTFLLAGGRPLDLVFEECDDLKTKFLVRERARHHRIPVLMETSDRGLMDIERFDLEPDRPLFHGLVGDVDVSGLENLTNLEKVPLMLKIIGLDSMAPRMLASMIDIDTTLKSWPQLASEVAIGAGINVDTARRIALGQLTTSGRFYLDLHSAIHDDAPRPFEQVPVTVESVCPESMQGFDLPALSHVQAVDTDTLVRLSTWATTAFSGGNSQPWQLRHGPGRLTLLHDKSRSKNLFDPAGRSGFLAFGSMIETLALVGPAMGLSVDSQLFPDGNNPDRVCDVHVALAPGIPTVDPLVHGLSQRVANRRLGPREPADPAVLAELQRDAAGLGTTLQFLEDPRLLHQLASLLGAAERLKFLDPAIHAQMMAELRWDAESVATSRDGIDLLTLDLPPADLAGLAVLRKWPVLASLADVGGGTGLERGVRASVNSASAMGLLTVPTCSPEGFVQAGRALQRIWTRANQAGWALQPLTSITYLMLGQQLGSSGGFSLEQNAEIARWWSPFRALFPSPAGHGDAMLFRLARVAPPTARSLRRQLSDVLAAG